MFFILDRSATLTASGVLEKANLFLMNKEATEKNISLKTQLLLSTNSQSPKKISGEQLWRKQGFFLTTGFFSNKRADFNFEKRNFPENALCYINQGYQSMVKGGKLAICNTTFFYWGS